MLEDIYRQHGRAVFATLIRLLKDFDIAEEALQEAFKAALEQWPRDGVPANPKAWLVSTGRFKGIDLIRRLSRYQSLPDDLAEQLSIEAEAEVDKAAIEDDRLRLIFTCCHPALSPDAQIALTLREVCGLKTEEIACAFLIPAPTLAQRIVRAKNKIREARIPYQVPEADNLQERLDSVLHVLYLIFNEGYFASGGRDLTRPELSSEAIRLGRLLLELQPATETMGLLALMLLQESRRAARTSTKGDLILLEDQNRSLWNASQIEEGTVLVERALASRNVGVYTLQAAIAALHANAASSRRTDWPQIVALYDVLLGLQASPIVELNRAAAIAMRDGADAGLALIDALLERGELSQYRLIHAARADLLRRLRRKSEAIAAYRTALVLTQQEVEQRFLQRRLEELAAMEE
jgi:RNA polymerase sigma-70 factor (ECF subfamily)